MNNILHVNDIPNNRIKIEYFDFMGYSLELTNGIILQIVKLNNSYRNNRSNLLVDYLCPGCNSKKLNVSLSKIKDGEKVFCRSCGSRNNSRKVPVGTRYGSLTVVSGGKYQFMYGKNHQVITCKCDCGNVKDALGTTLFSGKVTTCGLCRCPTEDEINNFVRLYAIGLSSEKIATQSNYSANTILKYLNSAGVDTSNYTHEVGRIYVLTNRNTPFYIGRTQYAAEKRLEEHIERAKYCGSGPLAGLLDQLPHIKTTIVEDNIPSSILAVREQHHIDKYRKKHKLENQVNAIAK